MTAQDELNVCQTAEEVRSIIGGKKVDMFLLCRYADWPVWINQGQAVINGRVMGFSLIVQEYMDYEELFDEAKCEAFKGSLIDPTLKRGYSHLARCNDAITVTLTEKGPIWDGQGCVICLASASKMCRELAGKTMLQMLEIQKGFEAMLWDQEHDGVPDDLLIFEPLKLNPFKVECAMVPWEALRKAIG